MLRKPVIHSNTAAAIALFPKPFSPPPFFSFLAIMLQNKPLDPLKPWIAPFHM